MRDVNYFTSLLFILSVIFIGACVWISGLVNFIHIGSFTQETTLHESNKEMIGQNLKYAVFILNEKKSDPLERIGTIIVYDRLKNEWYYMDKKSTVAGYVTVEDDGQGRILLTSGTHVKGGTILVSLQDRNRIIATFCISGRTEFWKDYLVYGTCDKNPNRPWGSREASGIAIMDMRTGKVKPLLSSDTISQFSVQDLQESILEYEKVNVLTESDWEDNGKIMTTRERIDLSKTVQ